MIQLVYLIGVGVFAGIGQFSLTSAYRYAPAAEVSIYDYTSIVFSAIIGYIVWSELPDLLSRLGTLIIISSAIFTYIYNRKSIMKSKT